jgi:hypothetical protein
MGRHASRNYEAQERDMVRLWKNDCDYVDRGQFFLVEDIANFWPSTGTWRWADGTKMGFGVNDLISELKYWREEELKRIGPDKRRLPDVGIWRYESGYWGRR